MWTAQLKEFVSWYNNEFKKLSLYTMMESTKEGSPYHRESTVASHTDMVVMSLLGMQEPDLDNPHSRLLSLFAAAFHDTGKPPSKIVKHSESRGDYFAFSGHELISARLWQDYYASNVKMFEDRFGISKKDFYRITVMIEKHRPWGIKDMDKISAIFESIGVQHSHDFLNLLIADNVGRIQDDGGNLEQSLEAVLKYHKLLDIHYGVRANAAHFRAKDMQNAKEKYGSDTIPRMLMPIAQAGAGKSTAWNRIQKWDAELNPDMVEFHSHSMDTIRKELYGDDARVAFVKSTEDKKFASKVQQHFHKMIKARQNIYVDNTNLSTKRRRFYLTEARKHGYHCQAILFPMSIKEAISRNSNRSDNDRVPIDVVVRQYNSLVMPMMMTEFDQITFM